MELYLMARKLLNPLFPFWEYVLQLPRNYKIIILLVLIIGILFRCYHFLNIGYYFDTVSTQYEWGKVAWEKEIFGFWQSYPLDKIYDYPVLSLIYESIVYGISGGHQFIFVVLLKLFNSIADFSCIILLVFIAERYFLSNKITNINIDKQNFRKYILIFSLLLWLLPSLWFVSAVWGQNDSLIVALFLISVMFLYEKKYFFSGLIIAISLLIKPQLLICLPVFLLYFVQFFNKKFFKQYWAWLLPVLLFAGINLICALLMKNDIQYVLGEYLRNNFTVSLNTQSQNLIIILALNLIIFAIYCVYILMRLWKSKHSFLLWLLGIVLPILTMLSVLLPINFFRTLKVTLEPLLRSYESDISGSAVNIWTLLGFQGKASSSLFGSLSFSVSGILLFILFLVIFLIAFYRLSFSLGIKSILQKIYKNQINVLEFINLSIIINILYFIFFTNVHSRYLHLSIILLPLPLVYFMASKKLNRSTKIIIFISYLIISFGYFIGNLIVFNQKEPNFGTYLPIISVEWVRTLSNLLGDWGRILTGGSIITISLAFYFIAFRYYLNDKSGSEL